MSETLSRAAVGRSRLRSIVAGFSVFLISILGLSSSSVFAVADEDFVPVQGRSGDDITGPIYDQSFPRMGNGYEWHHNINGMTTHWLGAFAAVDNVPEWCINLFANEPAGPGEIVTDFAPNPVSGVLGDLQIGTNAQMGWVFKALDDGRIDITDPTNPGAIALIIHANYEQGQGRDFARQLVLDIMASTNPAIRVRAQEIVAAAKNSAAVEVIPGDVAVSEDQMNFTLTGAGYKNASGGWVEGIPYTATIPDSMKAVFSNGQKTISGVTTNGPITLTGKSTGNTTGHIKWVFKKNSVAVELRERYGSQTTIRPQGSDPGTVSGQSRDFDLLFDFQPVGVSSVSGAGSKVVDEGKLSDSLTLSADPNYGDGTWTVKNGKPVPVKAVGTAYYTGETPAVESDGVPASAVEVGSASLTFDGPGTKTATIEGDYDPQFVTWVWKIVKADQGVNAVYVHADWSDKFGVGDETTSIRKMIEIDSNLGIRMAKSGTYLVDDIWISGFQSDHPNFSGSHGFKADVKSVDHVFLKFPKGLDITDANEDKAETITTVTTPAANGFYPSNGSIDAKIKDLAPGDCYVVQHRFAGDDRVKPFKSSVEDVNQQYCVEEVVPVLKSVATDTADGDKVLKADKNASITDVVSDVNKSLLVGSEYEIRTTLQVLPDDKPLLDAKGGSVTVTTKFVPKKSDEQAIIDIPFDATGLAGKKVNVFEDIYLDGKLIASHADITDKDQTVTFEENPVTPTPSSPAPEKPKGKLAKTGATAGVIVASVLALGGLGTGAYVVSRKRKSVVGQSEDL